MSEYEIRKLILQELAPIKEHINSITKQLDDITHMLYKESTNSISENQDAIFEIAQIADENSDAILELAEMMNEEG